MSFKVGADDAEYMEKEYAPLLSQQDIIGIANFTAYCKLNIDNATTRPFDLKTIWDNNYKNTKIAESQLEYGASVQDITVPERLTVCEQFSCASGLIKRENSHVNNPAISGKSMLPETPAAAVVEYLKRVILSVKSNWILPAASHILNP